MHKVWYLVAGLFISISVLADQSCQQAFFKPILQNYNALNQGWNTNRLSAVVQKFYANDAIYVAKNRYVFGKQNIKKYFGVSKGHLDLSLNICKKLSPSMVMVLARYHLTMSSPTQSRQGFSLLLWKKTKQGWKIILDYPKQQI